MRILLFWSQTDAVGKFSQIDLKAETQLSGRPTEYVEGQLKVLFKEDGH